MNLIKNAPENKVKLYTRMGNVIANDYHNCSLSELIKILESNRGSYLFKIDAQCVYTFYGRIYDFNGGLVKFRKLLLQFLRDEYKMIVNEDEISFAKIGEMSYIYTIPKYFGSCSLLREIHENFYGSHKKQLDCLDLLIYDSSKMIRYPVTKDNNREDPVITEGCVRDFIIEFINDGAVDLDEHVKKLDEESSEESEEVFDTGKTLKKRNEKESKEEESDGEIFEEPDENEESEDEFLHRKCSKVNLPKVSYPKVDSSKVDSSKVNPSRVDPPKVDSSKVNPSRVDPPKVNFPKVNPSRVDPPKVDSPKADLFKETQTNKHQVKIPLEDLRKYVILIDPTRWNNDDNQIMFGSAIKSCNDEGYPIFNECCRKRENYKRKNCIRLWDTLPTKYNFDTIKYFAKTDNPFEYLKLNPPKNSSNSFTPINCELNCSSKTFIFPKPFDTWITEDTKTLGLDLPGNIGKTMFIKKFLTKYKINFDRILFVTDRDSSMNRLSKIFKEFNFGENSSYDKIICKLESLEKLIPHHSKIQKYDLIILDDIERILYHTSSCPSREYIFTVLRIFIYNSKKILAIDSDFGNKSHGFLSSFGECTIIKNTVEVKKKHFKFVNSKIKFMENVGNFIDDGNNVVIVSMSVDVANVIYKSYKKRVKCVRIVDSKDKPQSLEKYQLVICIPSVDLDLNVNSEHFQRMFVVLSPEGIFQGELSGMMLRTDKIVDDEIQVCLNGLPYHDREMCYYTFDDMKQFVGEIYRKCKHYKIKEDVFESFEISQEVDVYGKMLLYDEVDRMNSETNYYISSLIRKLKDKGHEFSFVDEKKREPLKMIADARDVDEVEFNKLLIKWNSGSIKEGDRCVVERYMFKYNWDLDDVDEEFLRDHHSKTDVFLNLKYFMDGALGYEMDGEGKISLAIDNPDRRRKKNIVQNFLEILGFEDPDSDGVVSTVFQERFMNILNNGEQFNEFKHMFRLDKSEIIPKNILWVVNGVLEGWGMKVFSRIAREHIVKNGKDSTKSESVYFLEYLDDFEKYIN